jgi:hypothetical protein
MKRQLYYEMYKTTSLSWSRVALELGERVETVRDGAREYARVEGLPYPPLEENDPRWETYPRDQRPRPRLVADRNWPEYVQARYEEPLEFASGLETLDHPLSAVIGDE